MNKSISRKSSLSQFSSAMKGVISKPLGLALLATVSSFGFADSYEIDPDHANARFSIDHFNTSTNTGGFYNLIGEVIYKPESQEGSVSVVIPMDTINTGNSRFDEHLKSSDFFNVENYPIARFDSTKWHFAVDAPEKDQAQTTEANDQEGLDDSANLVPTKIDGELSLLGKTHPITLTATKFNCYFSAVVEKQVCGGDFTTTIDRSKWGIDKYIEVGMAKEVRLDIQIEAIKR